MIEKYVLNNRIDGWSGLSPTRKKELIEQARYNLYADRKRSAKRLLLPFLLLLAAGLLIVALVLINHYYFGASVGLYFGGLLLILIALAEGVALARTMPLIDEIKKCMAAQR
jgi:hypothetical protein